jgi:hypothetical protein
MLHEVPWMQGEGMPQDVDPHGEYAALLAAGEAACCSTESIVKTTAAGVRVVNG